MTTTKLPYEINAGKFTFIRSQTKVINDKATDYVLDDTYATPGGGRATYEQIKEAFGSVSTGRK